MVVTDLPAVNATLNGISALLLMCGYVAIRNGAREAHKRCMLGALTTSTLFLACYVVYHLQVGSVPFPGTGLARLVYFTILVTHVILAAAIVPLVIITSLRGLRSQFERHVRIARWTFPLWLYVSVTGVVIYLMLYRIY
ncbi:MAG: DUF420 domain-containing protein [Vicinamibacterales bacterium]